METTPTPHGRDFAAANGNGADNPWDDLLIHRPYNADSVEEKIFNKLWFEEMHGLLVEEDAPLLCCLAPSKTGQCLAAEVLPEFLEQGCSLILDEACLTPLSCRFPNHVTFCASVTEIFSAADLFLALPGNGLISLAMRYGTVPVVFDCTDNTRHFRADTQFAFASWTPEALRGAIVRALQLYRDPMRWEALERQCME